MLWPAQRSIAILLTWQPQLTALLHKWLQELLTAKAGRCLCIMTHLCSNLRCWPCSKPKASPLARPEATSPPQLRPWIPACLRDCLAVLGILSLSSWGVSLGQFGPSAEHKSAARSLLPLSARPAGLRLCCAFLVSALTALTFTTACQLALSIPVAVDIME